MYKIVRNLHEEVVNSLQQLMIRTANIDWECRETTYQVYQKTSYGWIQLHPPVRPMRIGWKYVYDDPVKEKYS